MDAFDDTFDQADIAEDQAGLHSFDRGGADGFLRAVQLDPRQHRSSRSEGFCGGGDAGGDGAADVITAGRDGIEGGGGAEVDDDAGGLVEVKGGGGVHDAVGADLPGIVHADLDPGFGAGAYGQRVGVEVAAAQLFEGIGQRRHHGTQGDLIDRFRVDSVDI